MPLEPIEGGSKAKLVTEERPSSRGEQLVRDSRVLVAPKDAVATAAEPATEASADVTSADSAERDAAVAILEAEDAATKIQRWWRSAESKELSLRGVFDTFEAEGLSAEWYSGANTQPFPLSLSDANLISPHQKKAGLGNAPVRPAGRSLCRSRSSRSVCSARSCYMRHRIYFVGLRMLRLHVRAATHRQMRTLTRRRIA
eukprot:SAG11_NODE_799_length_7127_cov_3.180279_12_plen_200_part_00